MSKTIPLIRAANVLPLVRWIEVNRLETARYLDRADLDYWFALSPLDPIPCLSGIALLRDLAQDHGPDIGARIVNQGSVAELGFIGGVVLGARTPLEALQRLSYAIPLHSSHETIRLCDDNEQLTFHHSFSVSLDPECLHAVHVLMISMLQQLFRFTGLRPPLFRRIEMMAHPSAGLAHISPQVANQIEEADNPALTIVIDGNVAKSRFRVVARDRMANPMIKQIAPLAEDRSLAASMRSVIAAMLHGGEPTVQRIARASGMSVRSLQRRLLEEGTSFTEQLDVVRRSLALAKLSTEDIALADLSERLGYSGQSALTRAIRRLTGQTPSELAAQRSVPQE